MTIGVVPPLIFINHGFFSSGVDSLKPIMDPPKKWNKSIGSPGDPKTFGVSFDGHILGEKAHGGYKF